eukprot:13514365-Heterocapsa_arctica.AAC.1
MAPRSPGVVCCCLPAAPGRAACGRGAPAAHPGPALRLRGARLQLRHPRHLVAVAPLRPGLPLMADCV